MKKTDALEFFNGAAKMAYHIGVTARTVRNWPDVLKDSQISMVVGAAVKYRGVVKARAWFPDHIEGAGA